MASYLFALHVVWPLYLNEPKNSKGARTQIVYTLGPMFLQREYFKAKVYTIWVHGPLGQRTFCQFFFPVFGAEVFRICKDDVLAMGCFGSASETLNT